MTKIELSSSEIKFILDFIEQKHKWSRTKESLSVEKKLKSTL